MIFFLYLSPLKVCHHARCSFSVGSTCKVVGSLGGGFSRIGQLEREITEGVVALKPQKRTNTDYLGVTLKKTQKLKNKEKKKSLQTQLQGEGVTIIEDLQRVKQKQFSSCCDSIHPIHKRGWFYIMTSSVDIFSAVKKKKLRSRQSL